MNCNKIVLILFIISFSSPLLSDEFHYNNILIGNRSNGLGGAYTAVSDDASGLYFNPAGIIFAKDKKLSASVNGFHSTTTTYKNVLGGGDWNRNSSALLPNFFGITKKLGTNYFGFSYAVTDSIIENQDSRFTTLTNIPEYIVNINNRDSTILIGPTYARQITDSLNFGITLYFHRREKELINNQWIKRSDNSFEWSNLYYETHESGLNPVIGLLWSPSNDLSIGLSFRKTIISHSHTRSQQTCVSDINNPIVQSSQCIPLLGVPNDPTINTSSEKRSLPTNTRVGIAYFPNDRFLVDVDVSYYEASSDAFSDRKSTTNYAIGAEYYMSRTWVLRGGIFTDNANTPRVLATNINQNEHVDIMGVSLGLTSISKNSSITFGITSTSGSGQAQVISGVMDVQDVEKSSNTIFISSSYEI